MIEIHNVPLIKGTTFSDLEQGLLAYKKSQLLQIAEKQQVPVRKSATKAKMVEQLKPVIIKNAAHFFAQLDENGAQIIADLAKVASLVVSDETLRAVQSSIESGYLLAFQVKNVVTLVIPNELISSIKGEMSPVPVVGELKNQSLFLQQLENAQKIYGTYNLKYLVLIWNNYFPQSLTVEEAAALIEMRR
ncbi:hypothetical protein [Carnobacterium pleistocenium]|uniref:hypothetical protein n=1 Tax=Carnobacterium pleistocenium TaxID=181073 RepID=UPI00054DBEDF|nr:hypothetical protein [Carnobacterium pleistocenium]